ncbi:uncharacterized protein (DUF983 family) [Flavobacterium arsenatis]|uniref:Uncharacterized protein (DUF983 family) n=1 Tax=Flavobacterium arsenatis TaxID=1484332 RepID=A0ABU1TJP4_9FLAO|nr:DUF983 domain-containing protein [Flavobacterium arsenatis]MDR6966214.1 uncharacterized protein (DUF983 family) [Flavobacterium arsenatis]
MLKKGSKLYSILTGTCPKCQNESMYEDQNLLHLSKIIKMKEKCSHCGLKYQIEPSFFYGAMYVSYGLNVAIGILAFIICFQFSRSMLVNFTVILGAIIISFPLVMRLSRSIYINMFVSYKKDFKK